MAVYAAALYQNCNTIPELLAALLRLRNDPDAIPSDVTEAEEAIAVVQKCVEHLGNNDEWLSLLRAPALRQAFERIVSSREFMAHPLMGARFLELLPKPSFAGRFSSNRFYLAEKTRAATFEHCQTITDILAVLAPYIEEAPKDVRESVQGVSSPHVLKDRSQRPFARKELLEIVNKLQEIVEKVNTARPEEARAFCEEAQTSFTSTAGLREAVVRVAGNQLARRQKFSDTHVAVVDFIHKKFPLEREIFNEAALTSMAPVRSPLAERPARLPQPEAPRRRASVPPAPAEYRSPAPVARRSADAAILPRSRRFLTGGRIAALLGVLGVGGVGVGTAVGGAYYLHTHKSEQQDPSASGDTTDTGPDPFEDRSKLFELSDEQRKELLAAVAESDKYYVPFVEALMNASSQGVTSDGRLSTNPAELVAGLHSTNDRLHDLIDHNQVRVYTLPQGRESDISFGGSAARLVLGNPDNSADDLMVLNRFDFFTDNTWHKAEILEHETGHRVPATLRDTHNNTGSFNRDDATFGRAILATTDYSYYMTALFGAGDTIIQGQVTTAQDKERQGGRGAWKESVGPKTQDAWAGALADWYVKNYSVLQPFGIDRDDLKAAILKSHMIDLGNQEARAEVVKIDATLPAPHKEVVRKRK